MSVKLSRSWFVVLSLVFVFTVVFVVPIQADNGVIEIPEEREGPPNEPYDDPIPERQADNRLRLQLDLSLEQNEILPGESANLTIHLLNRGETPAGEQKLYLYLPESLLLPPSTLFTYDPRTDLYEATLTELRAGEEIEWTVTLLTTDLTTGRQPINLYAYDMTGRNRQRLEAQTLLYVGEAERSNTLESGSSVDYGEGWVPRFLEPTTSLFNGSATFSYGFDVPPGRNGIQPNLSVSYSSRSTDTTIGWVHSGEIAEGWSFNGVPAIVRNNVRPCPGGGTIEVHNDFSLLLNGATHQLVETDGDGNSDNQVSGVYEAEGEPSLYIERRNNPAGNGSTANVTGEYWLVRTPDGTEYRFGYTEEAEQLLYPTNGSNTTGGNNSADCNDEPYTGQYDEFATYRWWLDQMVDSFGNGLIVEFMDDSFDPQHWRLADFPSCKDIGGPIYCRELANYPMTISYNNATSGVLTNWQSQVKLDYEDTGYVAPRRITETTPIFATPYRLVELEMEQNTPTGWQTVWSYQLGLKGFSSPAPFNIKELESIQQLDAFGNATLPPVTFDYIPQVSGQIPQWCGPYWCPINFSYPYLHTVDNGYGGIHEFTYSSKIKEDPGIEQYNYRVTELRSWDSVATVYGTTDPTRRTEYTATHTLAVFDNYKLVGFPEVRAYTYEGETTSPLHISETEFHTIGDFWQGKRIYERTLSPTPGNNERRLSQTFYDWSGDDSKCPETGLMQNDFVCLRKTHNTRYYYPTSGPDETAETWTIYYYVPAEQGGRQWGFTTRADTYYHDYNGNDVPHQRAITSYATNTAGNNWLALPWVQATFDGNDWDTIYTYNVLLYDGQTDPNDQVPTSGHLTMSRAFLTDNDLDGSVNYHFKTVDTTLSYDSYGNVTQSRTYEGYGEVMGVPGDWTWGSSAGYGSTAYTSTSQYMNYGLQLDWMENPLTHQTSYTSYHPRFTWLPTQITDANGLDTYLEYDDSMRLLKVAAPGDNLATNPTTEYVYDLSTTPIRLDAIIQPNDSNLRQETSQYYNGLGQVLQTTSRDHAVDGQGQRDLISRVAYDALGRSICEQTPFTTPLSSGFQGVLDCTNSSYDLSKTTYDERGGVYESIAPDGSKTTRYFAIPGWVADATSEGAYLEQFSNANGEWTTHTYNALGQLLSVGQYNLGGPCNELQLTEYAYDGNNNLDTVTRNGRLCNGTYENLTPVTTSMGYDALGRKLSMTDPDMGSWDYEYDPSGNLTRQEDGKQQALCFTYDALNRLTRKAEDSSSTCPASLPSSGTAHRATYTYDNQPNGIGQPATISWGANPTEDSDTFTYDSLGRLASQTRLIDNHAFTLTTLSYDGLHRPLDVRYPDGEVVTLSYDGEGADTLAAGVDSLVTAITFNGRGQVVARTLGNGITTNYDYYLATGTSGNSNYRLSAITINDGGQELLQFEYAYDLVGNITRLTTTENGQTGQLDIQDFAYDPLGRLETASGGGGWLNAYTYDYEYDRLGNLTERGSTTYNYGVANQPHAVTSLSDGSTFTYDANGNMKTREDTTGDFSHLFDIENRLVSVTMTNTNKTTTFEYDASGQRVLTVEPDNDEIYTPFPNYQETHVPENQLGGGGIGSFPGGSTLRRSTYYLDGQAIAQRQHTPTYADTFEDQLAQGWVPESGTWEISGFFNDWVYWQKLTSGDHHSSHSLSQSGAMSYEWDINFAASGTNNQVKASLFFYSDTPDFDNAYMISQKPDALYLIEWIGGQWYTRLKDTSATAVNGASYDYQATYDPTTGTILVYRDGELSLTWTDGTPLTSGSYIGLRTINTRARFDDVQANEIELSYLHSDHLGSNSLMTDATGNILPNSQAAYLPFGDWRDEPSTSDLTDVGYTGHRHNNTASNDLGLIYMNARYYVPGIGRFASADTIVPNLNNPQDFNRFSYVSNNPILFTDPTGHCAETGDRDCWEFLEKEFCMNGLLCENFWEWIIAGTSINGSGTTIVSHWTIEELDLVRRGILATRNALIRLGVENWQDFLGNPKFLRDRTWRRDRLAQASRNGTITLFNGTFRSTSVSIRNEPRTEIKPRETQDILFTIIHELGHEVDFNHASILQDIYHGLSGGENGLVGEGYFLRDRDGLRLKDQAWAEAFASWVLGWHYHASGEITGFEAAEANDINWGAIDIAVVTTLNQVIEPK